MLKFLADENLKGAIVRGLLQKNPELDLVRVQDVGLRTIDDETILEWCGQEGRILLTHDVATITKYAYDRIDRGEAMPGVFEIHTFASIGQVIEDILLIDECSEPDEWHSQILYLPLKS